jgi:hypothetical protein
LNADARGKALAHGWAQFSDPVAVGLDGKRFDQHVRQEPLKWEHSIYNLIARDPNLRKLLRWQLTNRGVLVGADFMLKYTVEGGRCSGDMNTSLGNVLLMCAMFAAYLATKGIKHRYFNDGDDCVLMVERGDLHKLHDLKGWFRAIGFTMTVEEPVDVLEQVEFCQARPIWVEHKQHYVMVRDPRICLSKDFYTTKRLDSFGIYRAMRHAVGTCGLALSSGVPVMDAVYQMIHIPLPRLTNSKKRRRRRELGLLNGSGFERLARGMQRVTISPAASTRASFYSAFGYTPQHQRALEDLARRTVMTYDGLRRPYKPPTGLPRPEAWP